MIRCLAVLAFLLSAQAVMATTDVYPALHDVIGVEEGDVLNIRSEPGADAEIIGSFAPDQTGIEVIRTDDRLNWALVNLGERTGWTSMRYLRAQPGQWYGNPPPIRSCFGTEPFWSLDIDGESIVYRTPEANSPGFIVDKWVSDSRRDRYAFAAREVEGGQEFVALWRLDRCTDGMSDREFGLSIDIIRGDIYGATMLSGCCSLVD